jgi:5'-3' exonuclease
VILQIDILKEYFGLEFEDLLKGEDEESLNRVVEDLVLIFNFFGNDFIPLCKEFHNLK